MPWESRDTANQDHVKVSNPRSGIADRCPQGSNLLPPLCLASLASCRHPCSMDCYSGTTTAHMSLQADTPRPGKPVSQPSQAAYDTSARLSGFTFVYIAHHHSGQQAAKKINHDHGRSSKEAVNSHHREIATRQLTMPSMEAAPTFLAPIQFIVHNHGHGHGHVHFSQP